MLTYVAQLLLIYLVVGPWKDPEGYGFPQTRLFGEGATIADPDLRHPRASRRARGGGRGRGLLADPRQDLARASSSACWARRRGRRPMPVSADEGR